MLKILRILFLLAISLSNSSCVINSTINLPLGGEPDNGRAIVVYGIKVSGPWKYSAFSVELAEYDLVKQNITGNCFRFNRIKASIAPVAGDKKYFAFEVPAGFYVYSPFHAAPLAGEFLAFEAEPGKTVYVGDFVLEKNQVVTLSRNLDEALGPIHSALPSLDQKMSLANSVRVGRPFLFMCTP